jgi:GH24 family phage-related lysozyme (muramidase)
MFDDVSKSIYPFNAPLEGVVRWPYQDILGLCTTGIGCLIEPVGLALPIRWEGSPDAATIRREWGQVDRMKPALHFKQYEKASSLRLTDSGVTQLLEGRALDFETVLRKYLPDWDNWPADAQLAVMGMAWACGPAFPRKFTNFARYANARDWVNAAKCAKIKEEGNPGIVPRNKQIALCLANAAAIDSPEGYATPALYWPGPVLDVAQPTIEQAEEAREAYAVFSIDDCGLTGHCHELAQAA